jgi:hypothetical protein
VELIPKSNLLGMVVRQTIVFQRIFGGELPSHPDKPTQTTPSGTKFYVRLQLSTVIYRKLNHPLFAPLKAILFPSHYCLFAVVNNGDVEQTTTDEI